MPATTKASVTDGPARSAMAAAVRTNNPAPMMAPMPSATSDRGPSVRLSVPSPLASASACSRSTDLVRNSGFNLAPPLTNQRDYTRQHAPNDLSRECTKEIPHAPRGIAGLQEVADHGDRCGAGLDDRRGTVERDAADRDERQSRRRGARR